MVIKSYRGQVVNYHITHSWQLYSAVLHGYHFVNFTYDPISRSHPMLPQLKDNQPPVVNTKHSSKHLQFYLSIPILIISGHLTHVDNS